MCIYSGIKTGVNMTMQTLLIKIPYGNAGVAAKFEEIFAQLHETLGTATVSLEIVANSSSTAFYLTGEAHAIQVIQSQIYGVVPEAILQVVPDPLRNGVSIMVASVGLARSELLPLKTYHEIEGESLSSIVSALSKCSPDAGCFVQIVIKPRRDTWVLHALLRMHRVFFAVRRQAWVKYWFKKNISETFNSKIQQKINSRLYSVSIFAGVISKVSGKNPDRALFQSILRALTGFSTLDYNQLRFSELSNAQAANVVLSRVVRSPVLYSTRELATWFHFPTEIDAPNLVRVLSAQKAPPQSLVTSAHPSSISLFGKTNFRDQRLIFGIDTMDRQRHMYVVGKSGSGKSKLLELLVENDLKHGRGFAVLDPHGDLVDNVLRHIPEHRVQDVVIFDPSDLQFPPSFNPLEKVPEALKMRVTIGLIEIFKKLFGTNWSPRLEHVLRYTVLALLDNENTTVLSILEMLSNKNYRQEIVRNIKDHVVKNFWVNEFAGWSEKFDAEAITPLVNKVGQFVSTNMIRNIVGQPINQFNFRSFMDRKKIVLMKISKGLLGDENASLLGAMVITKIFQAAMSRADISEEERTPFGLYVDEFHNFATSTFGEMLSEARKYGLHLTLANQFLGQLDPAIRKTVFGNVGSLISFRLGSEDAALMAEEFSPRFQPRDIINLGVREFCLKMTIQGHMSEAFSAETLDITYPKTDLRNRCIQHSRGNYAKPLREVEQLLMQDRKVAKAIQENAKIFEEPMV